MSDSFGERAAQHFAAAALLLGWRPAEFWDATPAELASALNGLSSAAQPADRSEVERLCQQFPDTKDG